ncbi:MAG: hypothetical protein JSR46_08870, partial [Verrucomicrobia bacterium]|nr:hypothetical protein [Verrucomicrobiota bacterium]
MEVEETHECIACLVNLVTICDEIKTNINKKLDLKATFLANSTRIYQEWEVFLKFTAENFFYLSDEKKMVLYKKLLEAEETFDQIQQIQTQPDFIVATFISILAQKHSFLIAEDDQQKNMYKIQVYSAVLNDPRRKYRTDRETLSRIITSGTNHNGIRNAKPMLSSRKSPHNVTKDAADSIINKIIRAINKESIENSLEKSCKEKTVKSDKELCNLLKNVKRIYTATCKIDRKKHNLTDAALLRIAYAVVCVFELNLFDGYTNESMIDQYKNFIYINKNVPSGLTRSLIVNTENRSFTILSKLHGDLKKKDGQKDIYITGCIKKISASATFFPTEQGYTCCETILAAPKSKKYYLDPKLVHYLTLFQGQRGLASCISYMEYHKMVGSQAHYKQLFLQNRAEYCDFERFFNGDNGHRLDNPRTWEIIFSLLEDVAHGISFMHAQKLIHWDLKLENIL